MSKLSFKNKVKTNAHKFAFLKLLSCKDLHSKMKNLNYSNLSLQSYLTMQNLTSNVLIYVFLFRVRMVEFWGNFRGKEISRLCPLCRSHPDTQDFLFMCYAIKHRFGDCSPIAGRVYSADLSEEDARKLADILAFREKTVREES